MWPVGNTSHFDFGDCSNTGKPNQLAQSVVELQLKAWKTQFSQQALTMVRY